MSTLKVGDTVLVIRGLGVNRGFTTKFFDGKGRIIRETKTRWEVEIIDYSGEVVDTIQFRKDDNRELHQLGNFRSIAEYQADLDQSRYYQTAKLLTYRCHVVGDLALKLQNSMRDMTALPTNKSTMESTLDILTLLGELDAKLEEAIILIGKTVNDYQTKGESL